MLEWSSFCNRESVAIRQSNFKYAYHNYMYHVSVH